MSNRTLHLVFLCLGCSLRARILELYDVRDEGCCQTNFGLVHLLDWHYKLITLNAAQTSLLVKLKLGQCWGQRSSLWLTELLVAEGFASRISRRWRTVTALTRAATRLVEYVASLEDGLIIASVAR